MLKQHAQVFRSLLFLVDMLLITLAWLGAYYLRFQSGLLDAPLGVPPLDAYATLLPPLLIVWALVFKTFELYRPRRIASRFSEVLEIARACALITLLVVALSFFTRQFDLSRLAFVLFWGLAVLFLTLDRLALRELLRFLRRRGYNQRHALVVGAGKLGRELVARFQRRRDVGIDVIGFLSRRPEKVGREVDGVPVLGTYKDLPGLLERRAVDQVFLALPRDAHAATADLVRYLQGQTVDVRIVPDLYDLIAVRGEAEFLDGVPIITLQASPLYGWNRVVKRFTDVAFSSLILVLAAPLMLTLGLLVKLTSAGPVFYRQRRMGYDGRVFEMLKFRSMRADAERQSGPVWADAADPRRTRIGAFMRRTSLDELPQFFNVLRGDMSIVGPRPERPELVEKFRTMIPRYMLRHKIKAGITGWAQINGWRGNTSLEERIRCDLEYIEKWSLRMDLKIMLLTLWRGFYHKNAY